MAKQRQQPTLKARIRRKAPEAGQRPPAPPPSPGVATRRSTYFEAVSVYEKGLDALRRHQYDHALELLQSVLLQYPEETDVHDRVRLYLNICERHATPRAAVPRSVEERLYASTLAINGGKYDEAISHLRLVRDEDPDNDHALYMLAVAHAQRGEHAEAVVHLERSIAINSENRALARRDPDLEPLRTDGAFHSALKVTPARDKDADPHRILRPRTGR